MSQTKTKQKPQRATLAPAALKTLEQFADPLTIVDEIETASSDADAPYWKWVNELMSAEIEGLHDADDTEDVEHMRGTRGGMALELVARHTGFAIGMAYAARLLNGHGDKLTKVARAAATEVK